MKMKIVVFGGHGWIGSRLVPLLRDNGFDVVMPHPHAFRVDDIASVEELLDVERPNRVLSLIGRTHGRGINTIDYLELPTKLPENMRDNLFAPMALAMICQRKGIHMTYMGTGCIFNSNEPDNDAPYGEDALPDFFGSSYSIVKGFTDRLMHLCASSVLNVRIRMPIVSENHPRNFITKITKYDKVCSMKNSMSVLDTLFPCLIDMIAQGRTGTINLTNPGSISHNEILEMYKSIVDPTFTWQNFTLAEQDAVLLSKRSNNVLDTGLLETLYPNVPSIHEAVEDCLKGIAASL